MVFTVADTGVGIPEAARGEIFQRFTQADGSSTRAFGGLGLGLALTREIATRLGGEIEFDSREGVGSIFVVRLPLPRAALPPPEGGEGLDPDLRVMVVDDNPANRAVAEALLAPFGVVAVGYGGGGEAIEAWRRAPWDLILMDIQMPGMDGVAATREIRRLEAQDGRPRTPIVAFTANVRADETRAYRAAGMDDVLEKPVRLPSLIAVLDHLCTAQAAATQPQPQPPPAAAASAG